MLVDFEGTEGDEITVRMGDVVKNVTKASEEGWLEGELRGKRGIFPANFVKVCEEYTAVRQLSLWPVFMCFHLYLYVKMCFFFTGGASLFDWRQQEGTKKH